MPVPKLIALTRKPSPLLETGERTHIGRAPIDYDRALAQHDGYRAALRACGAIVRRLDDGDAFADGVFVEDAAIVLPEIAIITRPGAESRRAEIEGIERAVEKYRAVIRMPAPGTLDGGDVVVLNKTILVGRSERTNAEGIALLARFGAPFGYTVVSVGMHGCLHLKSGCTALPDGRLLVNSAWIETAELPRVGTVDVPVEEQWGGDVAIANGIVVAAAAYPLTITRLEREGFQVQPVDVSEFAKAEGGVTCMSLLFES